MNESHKIEMIRFLIKCKKYIFQINIKHFFSVRIMCNECKNNHLREEVRSYFIIAIQDILSVKITITPAF